LFRRPAGTSKLVHVLGLPKRRRNSLRRTHSPDLIWPERMELSDTGSGITSQNPFLGRISGRGSYAPTMVGH